MDSATLLRRARLQAGLSQRELASRAKTSAAAICLYESGQRIPRVDTLARLLAGTGQTLVLDGFESPEHDDECSARILLQVLELAEHLPFERAEELEAPIFAELAR